MEPTPVSTVDHATEDSLEEKRLQECYHAFLARRVARGGRSIRTRRGYEQLRASYQPRVRFLLDQIALGASATDHESDGSLRKLVGPYVDQRVLQVIADVCWPLAHFGPQDAGRNCQIPEWQELGAPRYFAVMVNILLWMFPGLPSFEVQELMEFDWQSDRDFDPYGNEGLSLEGFTVSLIDLAVACTNGNVDRCLEFLQHLADQLRTSLTPVHDGAHDKTPSDTTRDQVPSLSITSKQPRWNTIPLGQLVPCKPRQKPQYYELKAKASASPMVLMVLAGNEKPFEFQLSSNTKLLVRERDNRTSVRRKTIALKTHLIEMEKQILWTLRDWGSAQPSVFLIPSASISQRALKLYGCLRLLDSHEQQLHLGTSDELVDLKKAPTPIFTVYTSIQDPTTIAYGGEESTCGRIDRQGSQLFVLDHRQRREPFVVTLKTSLLQSTNAGGGAGAVAVVSQSSTATTKMIIDDTIIELAPSSTASGDAGVLSPHTFVFVVKDQNEFATPNGAGVHRQTCALPQQWYCAISAADESKQIVVQTHASSVHNTSGLYYLYIFSLHGVYYEAIYDKMSDEDQEAADDHAVSSSYASTRSQQTPSDDIRQIDEDENKELSAAIKAGQSSGAALLRCLLKLRQKRKKHTQAKPLPEFIEGTKVDSMKAVTAAATLRSKFLKAREVARHARVMEREKAFADGLMDLATKHNASFKRSRQPPKESSSHSNLLANSSSSSNVTSSDNALEPQVQLLASFFREMAVHVPPEAEPDETSEIDVKLVNQYGELFERDTKLLNMLDEEKWMPEEERLKRMQHRGNTTLSSVFGDGEPLHDDYINTAQYIEALMRDVAQQEQSADEGCDAAKQQTDAPSALQQLQVSWTHAQLRVDSETQQRRQTETQTAQFQSMRREEWMKSHHVMDLASQARFAAASSPVRTPMSLSKTAFDNVRHHLPWNPVWGVVDTTVSVDNCASPRQRESPPHDRPFSPKRPRERPKTTSTTERSAYSTGRSGEDEDKQLGRDKETTAASAPFAYANRLRLERVRMAGPSRTERKLATHSASPARPSARSPFRRVQAPLSPSNRSKYVIDGVNQGCSAVSSVSDRLVSTTFLLADDNPKCDEKSSCPKPTMTNSSPALTATKIDEECSPSETPVIVIKEPSSKKRERRKPLSKSDSSMRRRVKELLAVSKAVKEHNHAGESDAAAGLYPATTDFPIPSRSKVQSKTRK